MLKPRFPGKDRAMIVQLNKGTFTLKPQTALDHVFLTEIIRSGRVDEAYTASLASLSSSGQFVMIGPSQLGREAEDHCTG